MRRPHPPFPGGLTWADQPPAAAVLFTRHPTPARLMVPFYQDQLAKQDQQDRQSKGVRPRSAGTIVGAGEHLTEGSVDAADGPAALAPVAGRIVGPAMAKLTDGRQNPAIELEPLEPGAQVTIPPIEAEAATDLPDMEPGTYAGQLRQWIDKLRNAGIDAQRYSSPSLIAQLHRATTRPVDTIICNLVDDEPPLRLNHIVAGQFSRSLAAGLRLLASAVGARRIILATDAVGGLPGPMGEMAQRIRADVVQLPARYPQADAALLLLAVLDRRLGPRRLPVEQGVMLLDAAAAVAVGQLALYQRSMLEVPIAMRDRTRGRSHYLLVAVGTRLKDLLRTIEIDPAALTLRAGPLLRELPLTPDSIVSSAELLVHVLPKTAAPMASPCIHCGTCVDHCPTRIHPAGLLEAAQRSDSELAGLSGVDSCIECGVCSYVCPSRLPLLAAIRTLRKS